jgi:peptide/nickel transport system substrate-binding protein
MKTYLSTHRLARISQVFWLAAIAVVIVAFQFKLGNASYGLPVVSFSRGETDPVAVSPKSENLSIFIPVVSTAGVMAPIPYPDPNKIDIGGAEVKKLPINQIVTYKALPAYHQAPWMDAMVADGKLPAVKDRLPTEPAVYLKTGMKDGIGVYGDLWRGYSACPTMGYNDMAGVTMGWFGIESYTSRYGGLVKTGPLFRADQDIDPMPEIAKSWDWSTDGLVLTLHLIEGAKWSDGVAFNADDVMFTWEGYILDNNVNAPRHLDAWTWNNVPTTLEKVDDYTVKFTFGAAKPMNAFYLINEETFHVMPAHQLKALHPKWSTAIPKPSYNAFANALPPSKLPLVTMGPWVITEYKTDELMIMRRNPYYWKVDEDGNQLPYLDEIQYKKGPTGIGRDQCTIAGNCDHMNLENLSSFVEAMTKAADPAAKYALSWGPETLGYGVAFNYSLSMGIQSERDTALRTLFRDLRFRQALSYATDREGIAQSIIKGPYLRAWAGGLFPGATEFDQKSVVYYPFDVASARFLLDKVGLKDTNNDHVLEWTTGPLAGQQVVFQLRASQEAYETQRVAEALVNQWGAVGIKVNMIIMDSATASASDAASTWDMQVYRGGQEKTLPFTNVNALAPLTKGFNMNREGTTPRVLMPFEQQLVDIVQNYRSTLDAAGRKALMSQYNHIFTQNVYDIGVFIGRYGLGIGKRFKNVPDGTPVYMYTWVEDAILLDTLWTPVDQQLPQNRPNTLPVYP